MRKQCSLKCKHTRLYSYGIRSWVSPCYGLFFSIGIEPDDLSSVHLDTIPQKDRTYSALSKKKKRRSNNKKSKQTASPVAPKQTSVGSLLTEAPTQTFSAMNLNNSSSKEAGRHEDQCISLRPRNIRRHATHYSKSNSFSQKSDSPALNTNTLDRSGAESSGYHSASSLSNASSDSEYSDSEAGQMARLRYCYL